MIGTFQFAREEDPGDRDIAEVLLNHTLDTALRVRTLLISKKVPDVEKLEPAIKLAANIIDWFTPAMFESDGTGLSLEKRTDLPVGSALIAIASHQRIGAIVLPPQPDVTDMLILAAREMREHIARQDPTASIAMVSGSVAHQFLKEFGCEPGNAYVSAPDQVARNTLSALFAVLEDDDIRRVMYLAGQLIRAGFCPAFIVMLAPDTTPGLWVGRWPLLFPMSPYLDPNTVRMETGRA